MSFTKAQESRTAIERLFTEMRHLFNSGAYRPSGQSGKVAREALLTLSPEIYGDMPDPEKVELNGLVYVIDRLPKGLEECRFIKFISDEGYLLSNFEVIIPPKRVRNCYRVDKEQMFIEVTRGRSEIYDVITHLTFLYHEAEKIRKRAFDDKGNASREWIYLEELILANNQLNNQSNEQNFDQAFTYLSTLLGRTFAETKDAYRRFAENPKDNNGLFNIVYWLAKRSAEEIFEQKMREISFTPTLRERIGKHIYGERWASNIKQTLVEKNLYNRPIHIISANLHSFLNTIYAKDALRDEFLPSASIYDLAFELRKPNQQVRMSRVMDYALQNGLTVLSDKTGTNLSVQIIDIAKVPFSKFHQKLFNISEENFAKLNTKDAPVLVIMDYAFGEQAYETMDELIKPIQLSPSDSEIKNEQKMPLVSISVMGKAGILSGDKGDIMIPTAHVFEGTADNYPFKNDFTSEDFKNLDAEVYEGTMITVLGTSLQNRDVLEYFKNSSWRAIGLEMEGAHYQKAIQSEAFIRKSINQNVVVRYAYYASDNPLLTGSTLASGSLGLIGVKPTYGITIKTLEKIFNG
jgi:hypothetical protein